MSQKQQAETFITKTQAGKRLALSERRVADYAQRGRIERRETYDSKIKRKVVLYKLEDVERLAEELEAGPARPGQLAIEAPAISSGNYLERASAAPAAALSRAIAAVPAGLAQLAELAAAVSRPWLTLEEAEAASGLPVRYLRRLVLSKELSARNLGSGFDGGPWRIHRDALKQLGIIRRPDSDSATIRGENVVE